MTNPTQLENYGGSPTYDSAVHHMQMNPVYQL
jgi:hypothetical protein